MNRFQWGLTLIVIVLCTCLSAAHDSAGQSSTLTAFYTAPVVSMAPMWIAKESGFFKKQGLDVKLVFIASGTTGTASLLAWRHGCGNHRWICPDAGNCGRSQRSGDHRTKQDPHDQGTSLAKRKSRRPGI